MWLILYGRDTVNDISSKAGKKCIFGVFRLFWRPELAILKKSDFLSRPFLVYSQNSRTPNIFAACVPTCYH